MVRVCDIYTVWELRPPSMRVDLRLLALGLASVVCTSEALRTSAERIPRGHTGSSDYVPCFRAEWLRRILTVSFTMCTAQNGSPIVRDGEGFSQPMLVTFGELRNLYFLICRHSQVTWPNGMPMQVASQLMHMPTVFSILNLNADELDVCRHVLGLSACLTRPLIQRRRKRSLMRRGGWSTLDHSPCICARGRSNDLCAPVGRLGDIVFRVPCPRFHIRSHHV